MDSSDIGHQKEDNIKPITKCMVCFTEEDERGICTHKGCPARRIKLKLWKLKHQKQKGSSDAS